MARLLPLLILFALATAVLLMLRNFAQPRQRNTFRPRAKSWVHSQRTSAPGAVHVIERHELDGVRDAYSSAAIDPRQPLARCGDCQAIYHEASVSALRTENGGRCAVCGSADLSPVRVRD